MINYVKSVKIGNALYVECPICGSYVPLSAIDLKEEEYNLMDNRERNLVVINHSSVCVEKAEEEYYFENEYERRVEYYQTTEYLSDIYGY